ncbi:MAG: hypothetical protein WAU32_07825 [Thermoanaerobaculia bacterium]
MPSLLVTLWLLFPLGVERGPIELRNWTLIGPTSASLEPAVIDPGEENADDVRAKGLLWRKLGGGVPVASIALDLLAETLYAGGYLTPGSARVFRKPTDSGEWSQTRSPDLGGLYPYVKVITAPSAAGVVYAAGGTCMVHPPICGGGLAQSTDGGASWMRLLDQLTSSIAVDPLDARLLYAVVQAVIPNPMFPTIGTIVSTSVKSIDGGATWLEIPLPPSVFAFDVTHPGTVFAATSSEGAWKSTDSGSAWSPVNAGLTDLRTYALAVDPAGVIHLATGAGVFVSLDGSGHWSATGLTAVMEVLIPDPNYPGAVYAGGQSGVFRIDEHGTPTPIGSGVSNVTDLSVDMAGLRLWAATPEGVFEYDIRRAPPRTAAR